MKFGAQTAVAEHPAPKAPAPGTPQPEKPWWVRHYTFTCTTVGLVFIWFSLTPSPTAETARSGRAGRPGS
ncbi:hypothetical protein MAHJHV59_50240 [Mycobacterium avium subsp. hominissuis]